MTKAGFSLLVFSTAALMSGLTGACASGTPAGAGPVRLGVTACGGAAFARTDDTIVATLDGAPVTFKDLGVEAKKAEDQALKTYCTQVSSVRRQALDNYITEKLVKAAAQKAGVDDNTWVKQEVDKRTTAPTDADMRALYDQVVAQRPGAEPPPFEAVKEQIAQSMKQEKQGELVAGVIAELTKSAAVTRKLPDVGPPPVDMKRAPTTAFKGKENAKVTVVEFADFECPYCSKAADTVKALEKKYGDRVEFSYRHFPLRSIHRNAQLASEYAHCAVEQGKFWQMHDALYAHQQNLSEADLKQYANDVGMDSSRLAACIASGSAKAAIDKDMAQGEEAGVAGTPSFFVNGQSAEASPEAISQAIDELLAGT
jgi:protein-disulfide isomerase